MEVFEQVFRLNTNKHCEMQDITDHIENFIRNNKIKRGEAIVFCPHTTAAITINENADPDVQHDVLMTLSEVFPKNRPGYQHAEKNSDSHVKCSCLGVSERILIKQGSLVLGTWQGVYFCEFDGPRTRKFMLRVISY